MCQSVHINSSKYSSMFFFPPTRWLFILTWVIFLMTTFTQVAILLPVNAFVFSPWLFISHIIQIPIHKHSTVSNSNPEASALLLVESCVKLCWNCAWCCCINLDSRQVYMEHVELVPLAKLGYICQESFFFIACKLNILVRIGLIDSLFLSVYFKTCWKMLFESMERTKWCTDIWSVFKSCSGLDEGRDRCKT